VLGSDVSLVNGTTCPDDALAVNRALAVFLGFA